MANKYLMTIDDYSKLKRYKALNSRYKKISLVLFILLIIQLSVPVKAAECLRYSGTGTNSSGEYDVLYRDGDSLDGCGLTVVMSGAEYAELKTKADMTQESYQFDSDMYDLGVEGVIKLFVAGLGIGAILAMLNKIRR
jgi:hypothetical protein